MSRRKRNKISGQFAYQTIEMIESPAFRALSLSAHRVLFRIQAEHAHHAGTENGRLPVTFDQFEEYGVHRHAVGPAIRELTALGFITYDQGTHGNGVYCIPNKFRLTFRNTDGERSDGTHEWRLIKSKGEAEAIARRARNEKKRKTANFFPQWRKTPIHSGGKRTKKRNPQWRKPPLLSQWWKPPLHLYLGTFRQPSMTLRETPETVARPAVPTPGQTMGK
jgi:hypothetical protein